MPERMNVGNVTVVAVQDAAVGGSRQFMFPQVAEDAWQPWAHYLNPRGNLTMNIGSYLLRSGVRTILIDTGIGGRPRQGYPAGSLLDNLRAEGVPPENVTDVVITHLHLDHVGWNTIEVDGVARTTFPNARYVVARPEWEYWTDDERAGGGAYLQECVLPLRDSGQLDLVEDTATIGDALTLVPSPGHTPGHVCIAIHSGGERAMIVGDMAHHPVQLTETEWSVMFDLDPVLAAQTRARMVEQMECDGAAVLGGHFPFPGIGRLVRLGGRRVWQAE